MMSPIENCRWPGHILPDLNLTIKSRSGLRDHSPSFSQMFCMCNVYVIKGKHVIHLSDTLRQIWCCNITFWTLCNTTPERIIFCPVLFSSKSFLIIKLHRDSCMAQEQHSRRSGRATCCLKIPERRMVVKKRWEGRSCPWRPDQFLKFPQPIKMRVKRVLVRGRMTKVRGLCESDRNRQGADVGLFFPLKWVRADMRGDNGCLIH